MDYLRAHLWPAASDLIAPALLFFGVALMAGGALAFQKARTAAGEVRVNLTLYFLDALFVGPVVGIASAYATGALHWSLLAPAQWAHAPSWLVIFVAIFAGDFIGYWRHRFEHTALIWPAHAVHHSDTAMTWTTLHRFHPINRLSTALIDSSFLALLGLPIWAIAANNLVRHFYGMFIHMDLPWTFGPLGRVFVSPAMHRWHHVRDGEGQGANFATMFSVFDQGFGTHHALGPCDVPLGVREDMGTGAIGQLLAPFRLWWRSAEQALCGKYRAGNERSAERIGL